MQTNRLAATFAGDWPIPVSGPIGECRRRTFSSSMCLRMRPGEPQNVYHEAEFWVARVENAVREYFIDLVPDVLEGTGDLHKVDKRAAKAKEFRDDDLCEYLPGSNPICGQHTGV